MTATERVINYLSDHGPAPTSEIAQALSKEYGVGAVRRAVSELKRKGTLVDTGLRHKTTTKPEHILALGRELERARAGKQAVARLADEAIARKKQADLDVMNNHLDLALRMMVEKRNKPTFIQRVKRWFGVK